MSLNSIFSASSSVAPDPSYATDSAPPLPPAPPAQLWAMTIGISHYQNLPPLPDAERDAQSLHGWLTGQAGVSSERALLLTDRSRAFYQRSTQPDRATLSYWIGQLRRHGVQRGDTFWFFWSGYGDSWHGNDYLLPIDASPSQPPSAWIKTQSLLRALKSLPTDRVVVFLDIHQRPGHSPPGRGLGAQTAKIAQQLGITTVLSCQADPVIQEIPHLEHGLFTAALLDTLRSHSPHQDLPQFLHRFQTHLQNLCRQYDRPVQTLLIAVAEIPLLTIPIRQSDALSDCLTTGDLRRYARPPLATAIPAVPIVITREMIEPTAIEVPADFFQTPPPIPQTNSKKVTASMSLEFKLVCLTGVLSFCSFGLLAFLSHRSLHPQSDAHRVAIPKSIPKTALSPGPTITPLQVPAPPAGDSDAILEEAQNYITPMIAEELLRAIDRVSHIPPGDPGYVAAQRQIDRWSERLFRLAQLEANAGKWSRAIEIASQIRSDRMVLYPKVQQVMQTWKVRSIR